MDDLLKLNVTSVQTILELNDELKTNNFDKMFKLISNFISEQYNVHHYLVTINENLIYSNFELSNGLSFKDFSIELTSENLLKVSIFYEDSKQKENLLMSNIEIIKLLFNLISQTIYSKFLSSK